MQTSTFSERPIRYKRWAFVLPRSMDLHTPASVMQHAVLLGRDSWIRFKCRSYRFWPPRPSDHRVSGELGLPHHAPTGVSAYAINPVASDGGFHLRYEGAVGVILFDEPQQLAVNMVRNNGSTARTLHSLLGMLPQSGLSSS